MKVTPTSVLDGCSKGWHEGGLPWKKSAATRSTGDIIIEKDRRLLQAVCGGVCVYVCNFCVFTFIPNCAGMR